MTEKKEFTIIDAYEQFWLALENGERRSLTTAYCTYGYLIHVWNGCGRPVSFRRQNTLICSELCLSKPTLDRHRNILKLAGLINFFSKGKGDANIYYEILEVKKLYYPPPKKEKNVTTHVTTSVTTHECTNQSKSEEKELFVVIEGEVKKFYYFKDLFEEDVGLKMKWAQNGFFAEKFPDGIQEWMIQRHGQEYKDFAEARTHFLFWIPNYDKKNKNNSNGKINGTSKSKPSKSSGAYALVEELRDDISLQRPGD